MKTWIPVLVMGGLIGYAATSATAERQADSAAGAVLSHTVHEQFDMSIGLTTSGNPRKDTLIHEYRTQFNVPKHYGQLFAITGESDQAVLWYRDGSGIIRNAVIDAVTKRLLRVEPTSTERFEIEEPR